jgi:hypothetical protein
LIEIKSLPVFGVGAWIFPGEMLQGPGESFLVWREADQFSFKFLFLGWTFAGKEIEALLFRPLAGIGDF